VHVMNAAGAGVDGDGACVSGTGVGHDGTEMFGQNGEGEQQQWRSLQHGSEADREGRKDMTREREVVQQGIAAPACYG
jgi:hypothetical protein